MTMNTAEAEYATGPAGGPGRAGTLFTYASAVLSVAIVAGIGVWGTKMVLRDVSGVPVVRAEAGPMRVAPEQPGGAVALNTGLAVNAVAAVGGAEGPEDRVILAPGTADLEPEDLAVVPAVLPAGVEAAVAAAVAEVEGEAPAAGVVPASATLDEVTGVAEIASDGSLTTEDVLRLADEISAGAAPLAPLEEGPEAEVATSLAGSPATAPIQVIPASVPGVARSLRPAPRPADLPVVPVVAAAPATVATPAEAPAAAAGEPIPVLATPLPAGTRLVQLGAFDSADVARSEWARLSARFDDYFLGKTPVIQRAQSGGKTFYRLRAQGFADLSDARRFCAALVAEDAACIPVVIR